MTTAGPFPDAGQCVMTTLSLLAVVTTVVVKVATDRVVEVSDSVAVFATCLACTPVVFVDILLLLLLYVC